MVKQITFYSTCQGEGIATYLKYYFPEDNFSIIRNYQLVLHLFTFQMPTQRVGIF